MWQEHYMGWGTEINRTPLSCCCQEIGLVQSSWDPSKLLGFSRTYALLPLYSTCTVIPSRNAFYTPPLLHPPILQDLPQISSQTSRTLRLDDLPSSNIVWNLLLPAPRPFPNSLQSWLNSCFFRSKLKSDSSSRKPSLTTQTDEISCYICLRLPVLFSYPI